MRLPPVTWHYILYTTISETILERLFLLLDYIELMAVAMKRDQIDIPDAQLACARISSQEGQEYLKAMDAAANFAFCNRSVLTSFIRNVLSLQTHVPKYSP